MKKYLGPLIVGAQLFGVGKARAGWAGGLFAAATSATLTLYVGTLVRGRALRKAPGPPPANPGETPLLHGPVQLVGDDGSREAEYWAYLSDRRLSLLPLDGSPGETLELAAIQELRPAPRKLFGRGPLGVVARGRLWRLEVPDAQRWFDQLQAAVKGKN